MALASSSFEIVPNARNKVRGSVLLRSIEDCAAALVNLDPQYRGVLDKLAFGNEGERQKARANLPQMSEFQIARFVEESARILQPTGHLFLWTDKFTVASGAHLAYLRYARSLSIVDMICWNKDRIGMGRRGRCQSEYLVVLQKNPRRAAGVWTDHAIGDCWTEKAETDGHPHAKPRNLMERLVKSVTRPGDLVVDPCAGGYGLLDVCQATGRRFIGGDLIDFRELAT